MKGSQNPVDRLKTLGHILFQRQSHHRLTDAALAWLAKQAFPGNIRELRNIVQAAYSVSPGGVIDLPQLSKVAAMNGFSASAGRRQAIPDSPARSLTQPEEKAEALTDLESRHIAALLRQQGGNRRKVAEVLGISVRTLYRKMKKYELR